MVRRNENRKHTTRVDVCMGQVLECFNGKIDRVRYTRNSINHKNTDLRVGCKTCEL